MSELRGGVKVTNVIDPGRFEVDIVNLTTRRATAPADHPPLQQLLVTIDQNRYQLIALPGGQTFQHLCLRCRPRKSVQHVSVAAVVLGRAFFHHPDYHFIRD